MTITGKQWTAVIYRELNGPEMQTVLVYATGDTTPEEIASLYPDLTWDYTQSTNLSQLVEFFMGTDRASSKGVEEAMLDVPYYQTEASAVYPMFTTALRWTGGLWRTDLSYFGTPAFLWSFYPDSPTYAQTTPTPFGAFGNGLIRHQALSRYPGQDGVAWADIDRSTAVQTIYPDPPSPIPGSGDTGDISIGVLDYTFIFTPVTSDVGGGGGTGGGGGGGGAGGGNTDLSQSPNLRVWGYSLDGHDFYVLRVGASETFIYDLTTGQWAQWASPGRANWRAHVGQSWLGMSSATFANGFGSDVVAGDDATGVLWILDPGAGLDDNPTTGRASYTRMVIGGVPLSGRDVKRCNAVQLTASLGNIAMSGSGITVTLRTSDDFGNSYANQGTITVTSSRSQVLEWRSLGLMRQPGRIFEISDTGITRISGADLR